MKTNYDRKVQPGLDWDLYSLAIPSNITTRHAKAAAIKAVSVFLEYMEDGWRVTGDTDVLEKHTEVYPIGDGDVYCCRVPIERWAEKKRVKEKVTGSLSKKIL